MLKEVVAAGGDRERFLWEVRGKRQHRFNLGAAGVLSRGPPCPLVGTGDSEGGSGDGDDGRGSRRRN